MFITIDTSALIAVIGNEPSKQQIIEATMGFSLCAPMSVHWEVGNAFSAMFKRRSVSLAVAKQALAIYRSIPIRSIDVSLDRTLEICDSQAIYAYDSYLIQCAQQTNTPLLSLDRGLRLVAQRMGVTVVEVR
jgi:predicted nucleic acid-binding protein